MLEHIIATETPILLEPSRRPRRGFRVGLAAAAAIVGLLVIGQTLVGNPAAHADPVRFWVANGYLNAVVTDPSASQQQLEDAFASRGFDIQVQLIPASPSEVGRYIGGGEDPEAQTHPFKTIWGDGCATDGSAGADFPTCPIGLRIPLDFAGRASIAIGRPAQPGEQYATSTNAFFPGEVLHCSGIFMKTVEQAEPVLEGLDEQVLWRSLDRSIDDVNGIDPALIAGQYVVDATPVSDEVLMVRVSPTLNLDPVARDAISELEQQGC